MTTGGKLFDMQNYAIEGTADFDVKDDYNEGTVKIYNLSASTINSIKKGDDIVVNAGYDTDVGEILSGVVMSTKTTWSEPDKVTEISCVDMPLRYMTTIINRTYKAGTTSQQVLEDLLRFGGVSVGALSLNRNIVYTRGLTLNGRLQNCINKVAADSKTWVRLCAGAVYIQNVAANLQIGFVLDSYHGLIGTPEKIEDTQSSDEVQGDYKIKALLNHNVRPGTGLVVKSKTLNGTVCVLRGTFSFSRTGDFTVDMEVKVV